MKLEIVYFGGCVGIYVDGKLEKFGKTGIYAEDLFNQTLDLLVLPIEEVVKYGISDESEFWDLYPSKMYIAPTLLSDFIDFCEVL